MLTTMLVVDLDRLERERRLAVEGEIDASGPDWALDGSSLVRLAVRLDVQLAGSDVVVLGEVSGELRTECRRCLADVGVEIRESLALAYQAGIDEAEAERREVYVLPDRGWELDLGPAVREHVILAVPRFVLCSDACQGLCPRCGANRNEESCGCGSREVDERWGPLLRVLAGE
ncbi:MAG TPA: DUF177 domain-containing protein [Longimicrobiales bacterium]|nr:DUF177 domain-containing protein [Longimicrobiales bacterium]